MSTTPDSPEYKKLMVFYMDACRIEKRMKKHAESDKYWAYQEALKVQLREICSLDFCLLLKPCLVKFLSLCSYHRPMDPHRILTRISIQYEKLYP